MLYGCRSFGGYLGGIFTLCNSGPVTGSFLKETQSLLHSRGYKSLNWLESGIRVRAHSSTRSVSRSQMFLIIFITFVECPSISPKDTDQIVTMGHNIHIAVPSLLTISGPGPMLSQAVKCWHLVSATLGVYCKVASITFMPR